MCSPVAGLLLSAGSGLARGVSNQRYVDEVNRQNRMAYEMSQEAREEERVRQRQFEAEQQAVVDTTTEDMSRENFDTQREEAAEDFVAALGQRPGVLNESSLLAGQEDASGAVQERIAATAAAEAAETRERIRALADLTGFGTTGTGRGMAFGGAADQIGTVGGLRRGSLSVGRQEQQIPAATVTPGNTTFLDILSGIGGLTAQGGFGAPGLFGGSPGTRMTGNLY